MPVICGSSQEPSGFCGREQDNATRVGCSADRDRHTRKFPSAPRPFVKQCFRPAFHRRIFVGGAGFAPAAIVVLAALQPIASAQNPVLRHVLADGAQTAQHLPGAVNVIHAPAAIPRAVVFLGLDQISNRASHRLAVPDRSRCNRTTRACARSDRCRSDRESRCDRRRACLRANGVVTSLSNAAQPPSRHWKLSCQASARSKDFVERLSIVRLNQAQRHQHHRGVVRVRIINVVVFERPAARFGMRIVHRPIAAESELLCSTSHVGRFLQRRMFGGQAGFGQSDDVDRRVPNRRKAGLNAEIFRIIDEQSREILSPPLRKPDGSSDNRARAARSAN